MYRYGIHDSGLDAEKLQQRLQEVLLEGISKLDAAHAITMTDDMELSSTEVRTLFVDAHISMPPPSW